MRIFERLSKTVLIVCCCRAYSGSDFCLLHLWEISCRSWWYPVCTFLWFSMQISEH